MKRTEERHLMEVLYRFINASPDEQAAFVQKMKADQVIDPEITAAFERMADQKASERAAA